jgi:hypothetical protein
VSDNEDQNQQRWVDEAEGALNRAGEAIKSAWEQTRDARIAALETAREAADRLGETIDQGIEAAKQTWDSSARVRAADDGETGPPPTEEERVSNARLAPLDELDHAAQRQESFRAPGDHHLTGQARDEATVSGWLPPDDSGDWPSPETQEVIVNRRQDLYDAMQRLESSVARASGQDDWAVVVGDALEVMHDALQRHVIETEADDGLFAEVVGRAPNLASDVATLRKDHEDLLFSCRTANELVANWSAPAEIRRKILALLGRLAIHRQRGAELLFDTYNVDLAAGD